MPENDLVVEKTFQDKMKERIKESIGELISNKELDELIKRGVNEVFFTNNVIKDNWGNVKSSQPSLMHALVIELIQPEVRKCIDIYVAEHKEEILILIDKVVKEGMGAALMASISNVFVNDLNMLQNNIVSTLQRR